MKICYLVLVYNELEYTKKTFESIKKQNREKYTFDIICIDNASSESVASELKAYCNNNGICYLRHEINDGYAGGNNFGWDYAKEHGYDYVFIANNDIELLNPYISEMILDCMLTDTQIALLGTNLIDSNDKKIKYSKYHDFIVKFEKVNKSENSNIIPVSSVVGCFFCIDVNKVKTDYLFDKSFFMYSEEQNLEYQLMKHGYIVAVLKDESYTVKHYGGFFDFHTMAKWKIYLSVRNWVLTTRNFSKKNSELYLILYFLILIYLYLKYRRKIIFKAYFSGKKLKKANNYKSIYSDAILAIRMYK